MSEQDRELTTKKSRIPEFKSYAEEAEFWDTHDFTEFEDETHPVKVRFARNLSNLSENVQVRFDPDTNQKLETLARETGVKKSTLIRIWVMERLQERYAS